MHSPPRSSPATSTHGSSNWRKPLLTLRNTVKRAWAIHTSHVEHVSSSTTRRSTSKQNARGRDPSKASSKSTARQARRGSPGWQTVNMTDTFAKQPGTSIGRHRSAINPAPCAISSHALKRTCCPALISARKFASWISGAVRAPVPCQSHDNRARPVRWSGPMPPKDDLGSRGKAQGSWLVSGLVRRRMRRRTDREVSVRRHRMHQRVSSLLQQTRGLSANAPHIAPRRDSRSRGHLQRRLDDVDARSARPFGRTGSHRQHSFEWTASAHGRRGVRACRGRSRPIDAVPEDHDRTESATRGIGTSTQRGAHFKESKTLDR